jgi:hypothetical protein
VSDFPYHRISTPHRWFLALVLLSVIGLTVALVRVVELKPKNERKSDRVEAQEEDDARRTPLPAGPRRFP